MRPLEGLAAARAEASGWLLAIAVDHGSDSPLHLQASRHWARTEAEVLASLEHGDVANARTIVDHALHLLSRAVEILRRDELSADDLIRLMGGAAD